MLALFKSLLFSMLLAISAQAMQEFNLLESLMEALSDAENEGSEKASYELREFIIERLRMEELLPCLK